MREMLFWGHLTLGLCAAALIFVMAATGVLLTYERQIVAWARDAAVEVPSGARPLSADALAAAAIAAGGRPGDALILPRDPADAVLLRRGRDTLALNPFTGAPMPEAGAWVDAAFHRITVIHRWLAFAGGRSATGAALNDAANLAFLVLMLSGIVLWWPKSWAWRRVRLQLLFRRGLPNRQARHYNWHHVLGAWALIPLLVIAGTAAVMSYPLVNTLLYAAYGEIPPVRGGPPSARDASAPEAGAGAGAGAPATLVARAARATAGVEDWTRLAIALPAGLARPVRIEVDRGNGVQPGRVSAFMVAADGGSAQALDRDAGTTPAGRARRFVRFGHTGEYFGVWGQTLAGLASFAAAVLTWTGVSLALRRLLRMRRRAAAARGA